MNARLPIPTRKSDFFIIPTAACVQIQILDDEAKNLAWLKVVYVPITLVCVLTSVATIDAFLGLGFTSLRSGLITPVVTAIVRHQQREDEPPVVQLLVRLAKVV